MRCPVRSWSGGSRLSGLELDYFIRLTGLALGVEMYDRGKVPFAGWGVLRCCLPT